MLIHTNAMFTSEVLGFMHAAIVKAVGPRGDHDDVMGDAMVRVLERVDHFDPARGSFATFCAKVAGNVARNSAEYEGRRVHEVVAPGDDEGNGGGTIVDGLPGADGRAEVARSMGAQELAEAISEIDDPDDRAFFRALIRGVPIGEAGKALGWHAVKATRKRAALLAELREAMGTPDDPEDDDSAE